MRRIASLLLLVAIALGAHAENLPISVETPGGVTRLTFLSPTIVRVEHTTAQAKEPARSLVVTLEPQRDLKVSVRRSATETTAQSSQLSATIDQRTGLVSFASRARASLLLK